MVMTKKRRTKKAHPKKYTQKPKAESGVGRGYYLDRSETIFVPVRCPKCGSEKREPFSGNQRRVATSGVSPLTGKKYNVVIFRNTKCLDCGQALSAKSYEWSADQQKQADAISEHRRRTN